MPLILLTQMNKIKMPMQLKVLQIKHRVQRNKIRLRVPTIQNQVQVPPAQIPIQVPAAQIPIQGPAQIGQNIPIQPLQQRGPYATSPCWYDSACSPDNLPKLDWEETRIFRVSQKRMQNPIFLVLDTGWKPIISQKEKRLDIFA